MYLENKILAEKIIKYGIGGGIAAVLDLFLLYIFTDILNIFYILSSIFSFSIVFLVGFLYQKHIAFGHKKGSNLKQGFLFLVFQLLGMLMNVCLLWIFVTKFGFYYLYVAFVNKWIIFIWNFTMNYFFTFK